MPRFFSDLPLRLGEMDLPERAARHVQVLRLQPGDEITLFDGAGGQWQAVITDMRKRVAVKLVQHQDVECEATHHVTLAIGMPANERMDWLIEKATELGVSEIQPLATERSVLKLSGERAEKKLAHWQGVAIAACEQCGRNRVPQIHPVMSLQAYFSGVKLEPKTTKRFVLSLQSAASTSVQLQSLPPEEKLIFLSGPEGGLSTAEEGLAMDEGFTQLSLGARVLRAETAPLVILSIINTA